MTEVLEEFGLEEFKDRKAGALSGGQKRRLALAGAVLTKPRLLILDEPTSEVDPNTRRDMWERFFRIASEGTSILVSTHLMDEAERCHALTILDRGRKVADGEVSHLREDMDEKIVLVTGPEVAGVTERIKTTPGVIAVTQVGLRLRVILEATVTEPAQLVHRAVGGNYAVEATGATIEDVFVVATGGRGSA